MIRCYRDSHGLPRADVGDGHPIIGRFLEDDIQSSTNTCREYWAGMEDVEQGRLPEWSGTGNAHTVTIRPNGATVEDALDLGRGEAELSLDEFKQCLKAWLECISSPPGTAEYIEIRGTLIVAEKFQTDLKVVKSSYRELCTGVSISSGEAVLPLYVAEGPLKAARELNGKWVIVTGTLLSVRPRLEDQKQVGFPLPLIALVWVTGIKAVDGK